MESLNQSLIELFQKIGTEASSQDQQLCLAHIFLYCLEKKRSKKEDHKLDSAVTLIQKRISSKTELIIKDGRYPGHSFDLKEAADDCLAYLQKYSFQGAAYNGILWWLLKGTFDDEFQTADASRDICNKAGVTALYTVSTPADSLVKELGFGRDLGENAIDSSFGSGELVGRREELEKHLGFLQIAVNQGYHYLLEGHIGVGKTSFICTLASLAAVRFRKHPEIKFQKLQFIFFATTDFIGNEEFIKKRFSQLQSYLDKNPAVIPIFDGLENILNPALNIHKHFLACFGTIVNGCGRTFMFTVSTAFLESNSFLRNLKSITLPELKTKDAVALTVRHLTAQIKINPYITEAEGGIESYAEYIVKQAEERYRGHYFPRKAFILADSAITRAVNRIVYLKKNPGKILLESDLWEHISEDLGLNTELFGNDPDEFYKNLPSLIKEVVIGQDHAVDIICRALDQERKRPSNKLPRGRFIFAGPPGVGKTQLARTLAEKLGYGEEAFFVLNMSEYSSDSARTRFMGSDPGYVGFGNTRTIYDMVDSRPCCVVLLDEIDRAHASIQDILLSILEGQGKDSSGRTISFNQAVFIMTTNQGQEQVEKAYQNAQKDKISRDKLVEEFSDEKLRLLLLKGVLDETEVKMKDNLTSELDSVKEYFDKDDKQTSAHIIARINDYIALKDLQDKLELKKQKTPLDRAFLDRIDFIIPFFPIKEKSFVEKILDLKLRQSGWKDCPKKQYNEIVRKILEPDGSVRMIERLIKKYQLES